jgi:hypothetical protein
VSGACDKPPVAGEEGEGGVADRAFAPASRRSSGATARHPTVSTDAARFGETLLDRRTLPAIDPKLFARLRD